MIHTPPPPSLLNLITWIIFGEKVPFDAAFSSPLLRTDIFLSTLFSNTLAWSSSHNG
jgi:hypothetical protein